MAELVTVSSTNHKAMNSLKQKCQVAVQEEEGVEEAFYLVERYMTSYPKLVPILWLRWGSFSKKKHKSIRKKLPEGRTNKKHDVY